MLKILPKGARAYMPAPVSKTTPTRSECSGWTLSVHRRNVDFLQSIPESSITGHGYAITLTVRDCPKTSADFARVRDNLFKRLRRLGAVRGHWVMEWQLRAVPHLHLAVWFPEPLNPRKILNHWLQAASIYRPAARGQDASNIYHFGGWGQYVEKHQGRSISHAQRSAANIPAGWVSTGRVWGHFGEWDRREAKEVDPPRPVYYQYRRLLTRYQIGQARKRNDERAARYYRRYLSRAPKETSHAAPTGRWWIDEEHAWSLLAAAFKSHGQK